MVSKFLCRNREYMIVFGAIDQKGCSYKEVLMLILSKLISLQLKEGCCFFSLLGWFFGCFCVIFCVCVFSFSFFG